MRIAFYAPLKSPDHAVPSGDRRVGRLLIDALEMAGHHVELASTLRSYDSRGDANRQAKIRDEGNAIAEGLVAEWSAQDRRTRPEMWFTYHVYHKAPDWLGPVVARELGIPYVIAEASYAPKQAKGAWAAGHAAAADAIRAAALVLCPIRDDVPCLEPLISPAAKLMLLPPFLDPSPYASAAAAREVHREKLAANLLLQRDVPWIVVAAMMRSGDKLASYAALAEALRLLGDIPWNLIVAGDGEAKSQVESALESAAPGRCRFLGEIGPGEIAELLSASDLCIWPAVNEAYGMAMLEAQAAGVPVVSHAVRGVPDVVRHGYSGLLAPSGDSTALAALARELLTNKPLRLAMGREAARFVSLERSVASAANNLHHLLSQQFGKPGLDLAAMRFP